MRLLLKVLPVLLAFFAVGAFYIVLDQPISAETTIVTTLSGSEIISATGESDILMAPADNTIASASTASVDNPLNNASIIPVLAFIWLATLTALLFQYREHYMDPMLER